MKRENRHIGRIAQVASMTAGALMGLSLVLPSHAALNSVGTRSEALAGAIAGSEDGRKAIERYLDSGGLPADMAGRAATLIRDLQRSEIVVDPAILRQAADRISAAASRSFASAQVFKAKVTTGFELGQRRLGFDFGPPDSAVQPGFIKVSPRSEWVKGGQMAAMRRPEGAALLRDGLVNVRRINLPVPDGEYRVMVMTDDVGVTENNMSPFGENMKINGARIRMPEVDPKAWVDTAFLAEPNEYFGQEGDRAAESVRRRPSAQTRTTGGVTLVHAVVEGGQLSITFDKNQGFNTYVTGVIVEPVGEESIFTGSPEVRRIVFADKEDVNKAEEVVSEAVAQLLSSSASDDAGATGIDEDVLNNTEPVIELDDPVSPN